MTEFFIQSAEVLILTIVIEVVIAWLFGLRNKIALTTVALINVITNPLLNYLLALNVYFHLISRTQILTWILEIVVVLVEWQLLLYWVERKRLRMFMLSLAMNASSYLTGWLIFK
jgi:hypothetical protein